MCGEHNGTIGAEAGTQGSSPHVRGAPPCRPRTCRFPGIIPACAGSTWFRAWIRWLTRDHPRMCGEHAMLIRSRASKSGSSPHVRGALRGNEHHDHMDGIIPACAGSTRRSSWLLPPSRDHPRMCGEHSADEHAGYGLGDHPRMCGEHAFQSLRRLLAGGSSPHVRGAPGWRAHVDDERGIIPACAGSTPCLA